MIVKPRVRGFMCITAHPTGCEQNVKNQIDYIKDQGPYGEGPKNVLVIGASTGYGLASRITAAFGYGANTIGVFFEKPGTDSKTASAGWYNSAAFHKFADKDGIYAKSINGDAFSNEIKALTINQIKEDLGTVDLVIYSLAAPRRVDPDTGEVYTSTLKPIGKNLTMRGLNTDKETLSEVTLEPATQDDIDNTVKVMGGEDWDLWIEALIEADVLADGCKTTAFTYIGEGLTRGIYWDGTIGEAKKDLDKKVIHIRDDLSDLNGDARVSVLKAVVTQASSAIPVMPLYLALLFKVMKEDDTHEGTIEQLHRLFTEGLYTDNPHYDDEGRLRVDLLEVRPDTQQRVEDAWPKVTEENLYDITDFAGYKKDFLNLFGFEVDGVDYSADVNPNVPINGLVNP